MDLPISRPSGAGGNCVRLGILWDGLEPEPGKIDQDYLDRIARIVGWAKAEGLYVLLDTPQAAQASNARIELIFRRHGETARRLGMPMLVGEWGGYYENAACVPAALFVVSQLDALRCGDTYWDYRRSLGQSPLLRALERR